jgi:UDPglucose--hexose-1-phosphate uridylyltransferase
LPDMPELRRNPTTREWVIIAADRGLRPHDFVRQQPRSQEPEYSPSCPFCPGNESQAPPAVLELPGTRASSRWQVRVVPNMYPALSTANSAGTPAKGPLFASLPGTGAHEVVVETPRHNELPAEMTEQDLALVLQACQLRYSALAARSETRYVLVFKNHGEAAGTSLRHSHSQIIAAPVLPESERRKGDIAAEHHGETGSCLICQLLREECRDARRLVSQGDGFTVFCPFFAARPAETWIVPIGHQQSFALVEEAALEDLASVLQQTLRRIDSAFSDPDFNYVVQSAPVGEETLPHHHWYMRIIPRLATPAGFELGSEVYINTLSPESAAARLRDVPL